MKTLKQIIQEKLIINHNIKSNNYEEIIDKWMEEWKDNDFSHLIFLINKYLKYGFDKEGYGEDYEPLIKYEHNKEFIKCMKDKFEEFKKTFYK